MSAANSGAGGRDRSYSIRALLEDLTHRGHVDDGDEEEDDGADSDYQPEEAEEDEEQDEEDDDDFFGIAC